MTTAFTPSGVPLDEARADRTLTRCAVIARLAAEQGGRVYYVGGCVRDGLLGRDTLDVDIEVHGLAPAALETILDSLGERLSVGESFGIYTLRGGGPDIAMPRRETATGGGHRDFAVSVDPYLGTRAAAQRRDFTVNALMRDVLTGELTDEVGGVEDLRRGVLRHVDGRRFAEDPLRVLRGAGFSARFGFTVAEETMALFRRMDLTTLARERVLEELRKALMLAPRPSVFFSVLRECNQLEPWFAEMRPLIGCPQPPAHHAEGDVWNHTMMVLDEAAARRGQAEQPFFYMLAALTHDFGKPSVTDPTDGVFHALGHEREGVPLARRFLARLTDDKRLTAYVLNLVPLHMRPGQLAAAQSTERATNRLFDEACCPGDLLLLAEADGAGKRPPIPPEGDEWLRERLALFRERSALPRVTGEDLIAAGLKPNPRFSDLLTLARRLQLAGVPKDEALRQILSRARQL